MAWVPVRSSVASTPDGRGRRTLTFQSAAPTGAPAFPLFLWRRPTVLHIARSDIDHAFCPLVKIAGALGMLLGHDANMGLRAKGR